MALKKIPPGMNYASIRHKQQLSPSTMPMRQSVEEADTVGPSLLSNAADKEERMLAKTDEAPTSVKMPSKAAPRKAPAGARQLEQLTTSEGTAKQEAATGQNVRFRGYVRAPAAGEHAIYDELVTIYGQQKALGLCLSMGMTAYSAALESCSHLVLFVLSGPKGGVNGAVHRLRVGRAITQRRKTSGLWSGPERTGDRHPKGRDLGR